MILGSFLEGVREAGALIELVCADRHDIRPCSCGNMHCWNREPGVCCLKDGMQALYPKLEASDILVLATPVYIPLPGMMQNFLNRLCPLLDPHLSFRDGRTRVKFRNNVSINKIALVSVSGWWEIGNFDTVVQITKELAANAGVEYAGAVLRPHAMMFKAMGGLNDTCRDILADVKRAGEELIKDGVMSDETLRKISRPLVTQEVYFRGLM